MGTSIGLLNPQSSSECRTLVDPSKACKARCQACGVALCCGRRHGVRLLSSNAKGDCRRTKSVRSFSAASSVPTGSHSYTATACDWCTSQAPLATLLSSRHQALVRPLTPCKHCGPLRIVRETRHAFVLNPGAGDTTSRTQAPYANALLTG